MEDSKCEMSKLAGKVLLLIFLVGVFALIQLFRGGFNDPDSFKLLIGAIISGLGLIGYAIGSDIRTDQGKKGILGWVPSILIFSGGFVWLFSIYLTFYVGVYGLIRTFSNFSWGQLIVTLLSVYIGWKIISMFHAMTEVNNIKK